ncbi:MAG: PAS domain S-box protein [Candidatus Bipolaricaulota bacterium]
MLGLEKSEITDRTYDDPVWKITDFEGNDYPSDGLPFQIVKETEESVYNVQHAIEWPNGEIKFLSINASPLFDEDGDFDGMVSVMEDITDQIETREELKQGRERYHEYFEELGDAVFLAPYPMPRTVRWLL